MTDGPGTAARAQTQVGFPFRFDSLGRTAGASPDEHVRYLIIQLLLTNPGERVNRPELGGGLASLVFAPARDEIVPALEFALSAALARWLGDVVDVERLTVGTRDSRIEINVDYVVRQTGQRRSDTIDAGQAP
ncbi:GPW/gp25 family protein [Frankia sp. ACN1ag]|uniref:GPW/gp25 family protein n=1 Tax=Frankia sp. ACN1ag TaxID=102891 RepID=UPI0006DCF591|nr:GPW/gp25 family protein [Frankia sp. ACN1ag]KQC39050.1 hypothetical protein UK82_07695 [Frankia sp. ACN1ag]